MKTVFVLFDEQDKANQAMERLQKEGYQPEDISVVTKETGVVKTERVEESKAEHVGGRALKGAGAGGAVGIVAGLLIGAGAVAIPGLGAVLIGGPLVGTLGLTGATATAVSGALTGILAGGLVGALVGLGVPEERAKVYEERIKEGAILLTVPAKPGEEGKVEKILKEAGADNISTVEISPPKEEPKKVKEQKAKGDGEVKKYEHKHEEGENLVNPIQIQRFLKNVDYPASRQDLVNVAKKEGADENVIATLEHLPDKEYDGPVGVSREIGKIE
jgi:uncharacterized membrane protein